MNSDPNARPPYPQGNGQPPGPYGPNQYGTPPPPPGQGGNGINPPYNPYAAPNSYSSDVPPTVAATPYQHTQYAPPPAQPGQPMPFAQNQYPGQFNYPQAPFSPPPRRSTGRIILVVSVTVVFCVIVVSLLVGGFSSYQAKKNAAATATAVASVYPFSTDLQIDDPMASNSTNAWATASNCVFTGGSYHILAKNDMYMVCFSRKGNFSNFTYQVTVELTKSQVAGLVFRADAKSGSSYKYVFSEGGTAGVYLYKNYGAGKEVFHNDNSGWHVGKKNTVAVVARGNSFTLYVNGKEVSKGIDKNNTYSSGQLGLVVFGNTSQTSEAVFTNAKVWVI
ncbi:MAG TPA: family 16 glycoside hydrolase [Ktedonobacteraceae bacterium]|jgi:hypothetical protein|nr:family 16 glycoside hydrolase [Ktedonobacteraceae bacterium]